jgi:hypothetical protein
MIDERLQLPADSGRPSPLEILARLGGPPAPFGVGDVTAGVENELQAVVVGSGETVDLPLAIRRSNFYVNGVKRSAAGIIPRAGVIRLDRYLDHNPTGVWENSWVRFPSRSLSPFAVETLAADLLADKAHPEQGHRADAERFVFRQGNQDWLRLPISYLIRLALADLLGCGSEAPWPVRQAGRRILEHFSNDNTSPEIRSFHIVPLRPETGMGRAVARETAKRYLLTQLLTAYANTKFQLTSTGQRALVYFAPHPPVRQKELNDCVSDAFYRDLFMSPCLFGWDQGEAKQRYMHLCHEVLSRSQLNAVAKLREAGIITRDLVVLPSTSNVSLANNGTHVSLGSRALSRARSDPGARFPAAHEKVVGDLAIKIVEQFLPLFVGTYSAAPYRLDYADFHPERVLGFLPHELDDTHLRMLWRRWQKKARLMCFGRPISPFGPRWLDRALASVLGLRGDLVPDFRLLDYPVALLSTDQSPALDGRPGNADRLKQDLAALGVFDARMAVYLPYRLREQARMGFSGFEGRHYSLFHHLGEDLGRAVDLQLLVTALAFKSMAQGGIEHPDIPDDPTVESERRQAFFAAAIGLPAFFVRAETENRMLRRVLERTARLRASRRHAGYLRVRSLEYRRALLYLLEEEAGDLAQGLGLTGTLTDLALRLEYPEEGGAAGRLLRGILNKAGVASALKLDAREFNLCAEAYYREELRRQHLLEAWQYLTEDLEILERQAQQGERIGATLREILGERDAVSYLDAVRDDILEERAPLAEITRLAHLVLLSIQFDTLAAEAWQHETGHGLDHATPLH